MKSGATHIIGIDEAGRGPIAGPVAVCAFALPKNFAKKLKKIKKTLATRGGYPFRDSKQLLEKDREEIYKELVFFKKEGLIDFRVSLVGAHIIDRVGISQAIKIAIRRILQRISYSSKSSFVYLDGSLHAPDQYNQETIIKGDQRKFEIALASICAKVERDRYMRHQAIKYPEYGFINHKGYGTKGHYKAIKKHGPCELHRESFLK